MGYVKDAESAFGRRSVFNNTSGTPSVNLMVATGGYRNIWILYLHQNELTCPQFTVDNIDFLVLRLRDLNHKPSPLDGVGSTIRTGICGKLNGDKQVFQKIFLKQSVIVFSQIFLQRLMRGALSLPQT